MSNKKDDLQAELILFQSKMMSATMAGDKALFSKLSLIYDQKAEEFRKLSLGEEGISPDRDRQVIQRLAAWDLAVAKESWEEARAIIPSDPTSSSDPYGSLKAGLRNYSKASESRFTANPQVQSGGAILKSDYYLQGNDGILEYKLYVDGDESIIVAQFSFENYGETFGLLLRGVTRR